MAKLPAQSYDWGLIKRLYTEGKTAYAIAKMPGMPTKQAIQHRGKRWQTAKAEAKELLPTVAQDESRAGAMARVLGHLRLGATHKLACAREGVAESTWRYWRTEDALLEAKAEQAQADYIAGKLVQIDDAGATDWKAAAWRVERHPLAREEIRTREQTKGEGGITIVLNIDRSEDQGEVIDVTPIHGS